MNHRQAAIPFGMAMVAWSLIVAGAIADLSPPMCWWIPPTGGMHVEPEYPGPYDPVTITVSGDWPHGCIPVGAAAAVWEEVYEVYIGLISTGTMCADVITPWEQSVTIGPLACGKYDVYVCDWHVIWGVVCPHAHTGSFWACPFEQAIGDLNCDGRVDGFDIAPFVLALTDPLAYELAYPGCDIMLADINQDGSVDGFDIAPFVELLVGG